MASGTADAVTYGKPTSPGDAKNAECDPPPIHHSQEDADEGRGRSPLREAHQTFRG